MQNLQTEVNNSKTLDELCDLLNRFGDNEHDGMDAVGCRIDLGNLPIFGGGEDPSADIYWRGFVFSWDDTRCIIEDDEAGGLFKIVDRTEVFGE